MKLEKSGNSISHGEFYGYLEESECIKRWVKDQPLVQDEYLDFYDKKMVDRFDKPKPKEEEKEEPIPKLNYHKGNYERLKQLCAEEDWGKLLNEDKDESVDVTVDSFYSKTIKQLNN